MSIYELWPPYMSSLALVGLIHIFFFFIVRALLCEGIELLGGGDKGGNVRIEC